MTALEANLVALEAHHPQLAGLARTAPRPGLVTGPDGDGRPGLFDRDRDLTWYAPSVKATLDRLGERAEFRRSRLLVLFGLGLGHELRAALEHRHHRQVAVIESDPDVFRAAVRAVDLSDLFASPGIDWFVGLDPLALEQRLRTETSNARYLFFARSLGLIVTDGETAFAGAAVPEAVKRFRSALVGSIALCGNDPKDTLLGLKNVLLNLERIATHRSVWALEGALKGRPAIVASAGPSLRDALPTLERVKDRVPIFCPDTSIRVLLEAGIRPHVAASRERVEMAIRHFEDIDTEGVALAACPVLQPRIFELHQGPVAFIYRSADFHEWLAPEGERFAFDGSAGNLAYRLAALAGCDPIILVGQDLCFGRDGDTHAPGTATGTRQSYYDREERLRVPGKAGGTVETTPKWLGFLHRFELDIAELGGRVINATTHGAHIPGTESVAGLEEILDQLELGSDPRPEVLEALAVRGTAATTAHRERLIARIDSTRAALKEIREIGRVGRAFAAQCKSNFKPPACRKPDLDLLIREKPHLTLDGVRQKLIAVQGEIFMSYLQPVLQPTMLAIEMDRYAAELEARNTRELARRSIDQYVRWFREIDGLIARAEALLEGAALPSS